MEVTERRARMKKFVSGFSPVRPPFFLLEPPPPPPKPQIGRKSEKQASAPRPPATSSSLIFQRFGSVKQWWKIAFFSGLPTCRKIEHQAHALTMLFQNGFPPCAQLTPPSSPLSGKISRKKTSPLIMFACLDTKSFTHRKWRDFFLALKGK